MRNSARSHALVTGLDSIMRINAGFVLLRAKIAARVKLDITDRLLNCGQKAKALIENCFLKF